MGKKDHSRMAKDSDYFDELIRLSGDVKNSAALDELLQLRPVDARALCYLVAYFNSAAHSQRQRDAANQKHLVNKTARDWVQKLWHSDAYQYRTKGQFASAAALKVATKFKLNIKADTIARDWLRGVGESLSIKEKAGAVAYVDGRFVSGKLRIKTEKM